MEKYYDAFAEVDAILDYLVKEDYNKIPQEIIDLIKENKNEDYIFEYDEEVELKDQELLVETKAILYNLFRDYLATSEQREKIKQWQQEDRMKNEQEKIKNYDYKDLFPKKESSISDKETEISNGSSVQMIEYKESWFNKIKNWLIKIFSKR